MLLRVWSRAVHAVSLVFWERGAKGGVRAKGGGYGPMETGGWEDRMGEYFSCIYGVGDWGWAQWERGDVADSVSTGKWGMTNDMSRHSYRLDVVVGYGRILM